MSSSAISGNFYIKLNGQLMDAKGSFKYNLGKPKKEAETASHGGVVGYKLTPQVPYIEGEIYDVGDMDIEALFDVENATITVELANGKVLSMTSAWYAGDGNCDTDSTVPVRFESKSQLKIT